MSQIPRKEISRRSGSRRGLWCPCAIVPQTRQNNFLEAHQAGTSKQYLPWYNAPHIGRVCWTCGMCALTPCNIVSVLKLILWNLNILIGCWSSFMDGFLECLWRKPSLSASSYPQTTHVGLPCQPRSGPVRVDTLPRQLSWIMPWHTSSESHHIIIKLATSVNVCC